jgi:hypothetical protein
MVAINLSKLITIDTKHASIVACKSKTSTPMWQDPPSPRTTDTLMQLSGVCMPSPPLPSTLQENNSSDSVPPLGNVRSSDALQDATTTDTLLELPGTLLPMNCTSESEILDLHATRSSPLAPQPHVHPLFSKSNTVWTSSTSCVTCTSTLWKRTESSKPM